MKHARFVSTALFALAIGCSSAEETWSFKASSKSFKVSGKLLDGLNISGAASVKGGELILACDELKHGVQAGHLDLEKGEITVDDKEFMLLDGNKKELDLEGAASDPEHHRYYTCGSCSVSRRKGEPAPDRQWLFRFEADAKTGALLPDKVTKVSLAEAMKADAFLNEHLNKSASEMGIDVEGIAFKDGKLWFGLRSPNVNGWGFVVSASADDLMAKKPVVFQRHELPLGEDLGIRDIVPLKDGFLLITGPTGALAVEKEAPAPKAEPKKSEAKKAEPAAAAKETVAKAAPAPKETIAKPAAETVAKAAPAAKETIAKPAAETVAKAAPAAKAEKKPEPKVEAKPAPAMVIPEAFALYFWAGDTSKPIRVGDLPRPPKTPGGKDSSGKPEALLVVSETPEQIGVIVFSDGAENGAPVLLDVTRPKREDRPLPRTSGK